MKRLMIAAVLLSARSALAESPEVNACSATSVNVGAIFAERGCCSYHRGVCGCSGGNVICCDGTYSPSCDCQKSDGPEAFGGTILADESVRGYVRRDGTYVSPHVRTSPGGFKSNNYSTKGNVNPYTGKRGTK